ncbi:MAG: hypothetical protein HN926_01730 [Chloroflexi bacterium]|jgi:hypothetical protein|nr:hypothetical protein [Chloroflexota bacterium]MBT3862314.1 hypothetical protein [Chloroflexota bacterium]MBT4143134.1 hypothetical protein [Chloroflexota bacterium]MBT4944243.1 hypothetical protein [Chloroflexota bacterium]MBT5253865.1 hypothetical protein [Chloroflexota bacterium]
MAHIPINLSDQSIHIHAQRPLAFEMVSVLGVGGGVPQASNAGSTPSIKVLATNGDRQLVEFHTPLKAGPWQMNWKTTEWVAVKHPTSIDFELLPSGGILAGGLRQLTDRLEFVAQGNCTELIYKSRFGIRWSIGGWLVGKILVAPIIKSHMLEHLEDLKVKIENRARRSRLYPQLPCKEDEQG